MVLEMLDGTVVDAQLGRLGLGPSLGAVALPGGVSNRVYLSATGRGRVIVKQSVERLMVADEWLAPRTRIVAEAQAMEAFHALAPEHAPELLHVAPDDFFLIMTAAPDGWTDWKTRLRAGRIDVSLARRIGECLADLHVRTRGLPVDAVMDGARRFRELRIEPYLETTARRRPALAGALGDLSEAMTARHECLVHGDFSPKNILTDGEGFWIVEGGVAHIGDPAFDVAFLTSHLLLKASADADRAPRLLEAADAFLSAYLAAAGMSAGDPHLARVVSALLAARVDGRSPVEYLDDEQRELTRERSAAWLADPAGFWTHLEGARA